MTVPGNRLDEIPVARIRLDGGTQIRTSTYFDKIEEYAEAMANGIDFPPPVVFFDGEDYWLADGFHRLAAIKAVGDAVGATRLHVLCEVVEGSRRAAILCACGANAEHGIQRTDDDKRNAVRTVLNNPLVAMDEDGIPWSDRAIGRICNVDGKVVARQRAKVTAAQPQSTKRAYTHNRSGKPAVMNTGGINKDRAAPKAGAEPAAPAQQPFKQSTEWDHLFTLLKQVDEATAALPAPEVAAANFPISLAHALPIGRVVEIQRWWQEFTRLWAARDPEIQRHRQSVRDFLKENASVAAE